MDKVCVYCGVKYGTNYELYTHEAETHKNDVMQTPQNVVQAPQNVMQTIRAKYPHYIMGARM